ncbi:MAG: hypothetical protein K2I87_00420 [Bacteroidales bacterium]|nr:hypothetical protein [Bacteroidales bacterium]
MKQEITETYTFNPQDYHNGLRKTDGKSFRDVVKEFEYDFHNRHSCEYADFLYANASTMHLLEKACGAAPFLSYGMYLTQGHAFDAVQDPFANHAMEKYSPNITVYGIDSAFMEKEDAIYPLTLLIDDSMRNGTLRLASPTSDDEDGGKEIVVIDSPKFEYV